MCDVCAETRREMGVDDAARHDWVASWGAATSTRTCRDCGLQCADDVTHHADRLRPCPGRSPYPSEFVPPVPRRVRDRMEASAEEARDVDIAHVLDARGYGLPLDEEASWAASVFLADEHRRYFRRFWAEVDAAISAGLHRAVGCGLPGCPICDRGQLITFTRYEDLHIEQDDPTGARCPASSPHDGCVLCRGTGRVEAL